MNKFLYNIYRVHTCTCINTCTRTYIHEMCVSTCTTCTGMILSVTTFIYYLRVLGYRTGYTCMFVQVGTGMSVQVGTCISLIRTHDIHV